jgi:penicillin-binding protein 1A
MGFRGAAKYLKQEEVAQFCEKAEEGIDSAALKVGDTYPVW